MATPETKEVFDRLQSLKNKRLDSLEIAEMITNAIQDATREIEWMSHALTEVAEILEPFRTEEDRSPVATLKRLVKGLNTSSAGQ